MRACQSRVMRPPPVAHRTPSELQREAAPWGAAGHLARMGPGTGGWTAPGEVRLLPSVQCALLPSVDEFTPSLHVQETGERVRLWLGGLVCGEGVTLQAAADALVDRLVVMAEGLRTGAMRLGTTEVHPPDLATMDFLYRLGEIAANGGNVRERLFG